MTLGIRTFINDAAFADEVEAFHTVASDWAANQKTVHRTSNGCASDWPSARRDARPVLMSA